MYKFSLKNYSVLYVLFFVLVFLSPHFFPNSYAHLEQSSSGGVMEGKYYSYIGFEPRNPLPGENSKIIFSIQDEYGNDLYDLETMLEIYSANMEKRLFYEPWKKRIVGDFEVPFVFEDRGTYQIVLSISDENNLKEHVISPRQIPSSSSSCDCTRVLFNVSVSENWNTIWNSLMVIVVILPFGVFGFAMLNNYKNKTSKQKLGKYETLRYVMMFLALAGGMIHLSVYIDHAPLRIEYGMFLLLAAISQIGFGLLLLSVLLTASIASQKNPQILRKRNTAVYLFGLFGTFVLLGLYIYAVSFPPPLSPENHPEHVDLSGIIAKSLEMSLVGVIVYVLYLENRVRQIML